MSRVKSKNTKPELMIRSILHKEGNRFRVHRQDLPGKPDIVLPRYKTVIFVHGCFWHQHEGCPDSKRPSTNIEFWNSKLNENIVRDKKNKIKLRELGWEVFVIWACEIKDIENLKKKLLRCLI